MYIVHTFMYIWIDASVFVCLETLRVIWYEYCWRQGTNVWRYASVYQWSYQRRHCSTNKTDTGRTLYTCPAVFRDHYIVYNNGLIKIMQSICLREYMLIWLYLVACEYYIWSCLISLILVPDVLENLEVNNNFYIDIQRWYINSYIP